MYLNSPHRFYKKKTQIQFDIVHRVAALEASFLFDQYGNSVNLYKATIFFSYHAISIQFSNYSRFLIWKMGTNWDSTFSIFLNPRLRLLFYTFFSLTEYYSQDSFTGPQGADLFKMVHCKFLQDKKLIMCNLDEKLSLMMISNYKQLSAALLLLPSKQCFMLFRSAGQKFWFRLQINHGYTEIITVWKSQNLPVPLLKPEIKLLKYAIFAILQTLFDFT